MMRIFTIFFFIFLFGCNISEDNYNKLKTMEEDLVVETLDTELTLISSNESEISSPNISKDVIENPLVAKISNIEKVKEIKDGIFQGVTEELIEGDTFLSINFYTWLKKGQSIEVIDIQMFNNANMKHGFETGQFYLELWNNNEAFFLSYHDLQLTPEFLEVGKLGRIHTSPITIGMNKEKIISQLGPPIVTDWYYGGRLYSYNDLAYILDDNLNVIAINLPGNRLNIVLEDVSNILGLPSSIEYSEADNTILYFYDLGKFTISFEAYENTSKVLQVLLYKN